MSKLRLELIQRGLTKESKKEIKHDVKHVMVQTKRDDQLNEVRNLVYVQMKTFTL